MSKAKSSKVFQPKVIIGSVTSFIIAAVGLVAVFFPDLFNLQKKSLNEKQMILSKNEDAKKLYEFLVQNDGGAVKLDVGWCADSSKNEMGIALSQTKEPRIDAPWFLYEYDNTRDAETINKYKLEARKYFGDGWITNNANLHKLYHSISEDFKKDYEDKDTFLSYYPEFEEWLKNKKLYPIYMQSFETGMRDFAGNEEETGIFYLEAAASIKTQPGGDASDLSQFNLEHGVFHFEKNEGDLAFDPYPEKLHTSISIPFSSNKNSAYVWLVADTNLMYKKYISKENSLGKDLEKVCGFKLDEYGITIEFSPHKGKYLGLLSGYFFVDKKGNDISLEPITKKEFELKNY